MTVYAKEGPTRFANGSARFFHPYISRTFATFVVNQIRFWTGVPGHVLLILKLYEILAVNRGDFELFGFVCQFLQIGK